MDKLFLDPTLNILDLELNLKLNRRVKDTGVEAPEDIRFLDEASLTSLALPPAVEEVRFVLFSFS